MYDRPSPADYADFYDYVEADDRWTEAYYEREREAWEALVAPVLAAIDEGRVTNLPSIGGNGLVYTTGWVD